MSDFNEKEVIKIMGATDTEIIELAKDIKDWTQVLSNSMRRGNVKDVTMGIQLGIDKGNFSRIMTGQGNFPVEKLPLFCEITGNDLPVHWIAYQHGYELRVIPKTLEEELQKERAEKEKALEKVAYLEGLMVRGMAVSYAEKGNK